MAVRNRPAEQAQAQHKAITEWLAGIDTAGLICRDQGHWWDDYLDKDTGVGSEPPKGRRQGVWVFTQPCKRGCGVKRTRYVGMTDGFLVKANTYDYSNARGYLMSEETGWMSKETRGRIRLERVSRLDEGEQ